MDYDLAKRINSKFILKCTNSTGDKQLIGAGQLHKFIGMGGSEVAKDIYVDALQREGDNFEIELKRGITIRFNKRQTK